MDVLMSFAGLAGVTILGTAFAFGLAWSCC